MMRHLVILARDKAALAAPLAIVLDRHLARGEQVDIMPDRRSNDPTRAPQWPTGRERRRSVLSEQLATQGFTICSRQEDHPPVNGGAALPRDPVDAHTRGPMAAPPPRSFGAAPRLGYQERRAEIEEMRAARAEAELAREAAFRGRMGARRPGESPLDDEDWPTGEDPYGEAPPRRRGFFAGLATAFAAVLMVTAAGAFLFAPQIRDYLMVLTTPRRASLEATAERWMSGTASEDPLARSPRAGAASEDPLTRSARTGVASEDPLTRSAGPGAPSRTAPATSPTPATPAPPVATADATPPRAADADLARSTGAARDAVARREAPPEPAPAREVALPPREAPAARELPSLPSRRAELPAASGVRSQRLPEFPGLPRVEVSRAPAADGTTFTVRLTDQRGRPLDDAQVMLRQKSTDGYVRETMLEPISPAGSYRGALPAAPGRQSLTVRVVLGDRRVEMPIGE